MIQDFDLESMLELEACPAKVRGILTKCKIKRISLRRVREVLKRGKGICLTLSYIVNRPLDLSLNSLNVRLCVLGILLSVFACSVRLSSNVT